MALRIKRNSEVPKIEEKTDYRARGNSHIGTPCSASPYATTKILSTHLEHDLLERCSSIKEDKYIELLTTLRKSVRMSLHGHYSWLILSNLLQYLYSNICKYVIKNNTTIYKFTKQYLYFPHPITYMYIVIC